MKIIHNYLIAGFIVILACGSNISAQSSAKIGFVNIGVLMQKVPQAQSASERLRDEFSDRRAEMEECGQKFEGMNARLKKEGKRMSDSARERLNRTIVKTKRDCKRLQDELQEDLNQRRNAELSSLQQAIQKVILDIAKKESYDIIFSSGPVIYSSERIDLTEKVLSAMRAMGGYDSTANP